MTSLSPQRALGVHIQRVDRLARGHEQAVALQAAEAEVGAALGQRDAADHDAIGRVDHHAVELGVAHAPAAPQIAVDVAAHAVRRAGARIDEHALVGDLVAARRHVIGKDLAVRHAAGFHDVEDLLVRRETQSVRPEHAFRDDRGFAGRAVDPVDIGVDLGFGLVALVIAEQAEHRIGEPDRAVGFHHDVVRGIQPLAVEGVHQDRDRSVIFGPDDAPPAMLAGDQPSLPVAGIAVGEVRGSAKNADAARFLFPLDDALVRNVAAQQIAAVGEPHRPLGPAQSRGQPFHGRKLQPVFFKARVDRVNRGVGIITRRTPAGGMGRCLGHLLFSLLFSSQLNLLSLSMNDRKSAGPERGKTCHAS